MKLYTRKGDDGQTSLFNGQQVRKDDLRVETYGTIDELNAQIGVAVANLRGAAGAYQELEKRLLQIQSELFTLGAELATPPGGETARIPSVVADDSKRLEKWIDDACDPVPPIRVFVLPGGSLLAAQLHVSRTVCRRAERLVVTLAAQAPINPEIIIYLNRLSDLLFAWARYANHLAGIADIPWVNPRGARPS